MLLFFNTCSREITIGIGNRPFPSFLVPLFQSKSKCETILMKMTDLHENETAGETHFLKKGFALRLTSTSTSAFCDLWAQQLMF